MNKQVCVTYPDGSPACNPCGDGQVRQFTNAQEAVDFITEDAGLAGNLLSLGSGIL